LSTEPEVAERDQQVRVVRFADAEADECAEPAEDWARDGDPCRLPRVAAGVLHVGAEERDEHRPVGVQAFARRLEVVAELVDEDQYDDAERELPAPDQRVAPKATKMAANFASEPSLRARPPRKISGAVILRKTPRQSVHRGWIGS